MKIYDEQGNILTDPDFSKGKLINSTRPLTHRYKVTTEGKGHFETVKVYASGGKDVKWVVDVPEEGYWIAYDEDDNEVETDIVIPDDVPHEMVINKPEDILLYVPYTEEDLIEIAKGPEPTAEELFSAMLGGLGYE